MAGEGVDDSPGGNGGSDAVDPQSAALGALPPEARALVAPFLDSYVALKTSKCLQDEKIESMRNTISRYEEERNSHAEKLQKTEARVGELEELLESADVRLRQALETVTDRTAASEDFRLQRDSLTEVRGSLSNMVETRDTEIECLKAVIDNLQRQLENALDVRCQRLVKMVNFESHNTDLPSHAQTAQIDALKSELRRRSDDLHTVRVDMTKMRVRYERQLAAKTDDLNVADAKIGKLREAKDILEHKLDDLNKTLAERREHETQMIDEHENDLATNMKLVELHKAARDDLDAKNEQLTRTVEELTRLVNESTDKCGELERKLSSMKTDQEHILTDKNQTIAALKRELENANDLLQMVDGDALNSTFDELSPSAHIASKLIKSKMSVTQAYDQLLRYSEELAVERNENKRLSQALATIVTELEETAPSIDKLKSEREEAVEVNSTMIKQLDQFALELDKHRDEKLEYERDHKRSLRENVRLKREIDDLGRQICFLLKETEIRRGRSVVDMDESGHNGSFMTNGPSFDFGSSSRIVAGNLVTFGDINELQANNQKLLRLVRELSDKREEIEQKSGQIDDNEVQEKLTLLEGRISELTSAQDRQIKMINKLVKQRDHYKKLSSERDLNRSLSINMDESADSSLLDMNLTSKSNNTTFDAKRLQYVDMLETQLQDTKNELNQEREKYRIYVEKAAKSEMKLLEANDSIHKQFNDMQLKYSKCLSSSESINEKVKILQLELTSYKKEIASLNEKVSKYTALNKMQQTSINRFHEDLSSSRNKLSNAEKMIDSLELEYSAFKSNSQIDNDPSTPECCSSALKNIEFIRCSLLDGDRESVRKLQTSLDEANRTCTSLRCLLQEEQEKYHDLATQLYSEIDRLKDVIEVEKSRTIGLEQELTDVRREIDSKKSSSNEEDLNNSASDTVHDLGENENQHALISTLKQQLEISKKHIEDYSNVYECSENELKNLHATFKTYKEDVETKLKQITESEECLRQECSRLEGELTVCKENLYSSQEQIKCLSDELADKNNNLEKVMSDVTRLSENAQRTEEKYAHEIILHSADIKTLTAMKNQLLVANENLNSIKRSKMELECAAQENKLNWENREKLLIAENADVKKQMADLTDSNSSLQDQTQALSAKLMAISSLHNESSNANLSLNASIGEDDGKSSEQLLNMVKYLRKERDVLVAKFDLMQAENVRIKSQLETTEARLDKITLNSANTSQSENVSTDMHSDVMRRVEELNAVSHCYASQRKERDDLLAKIKELTENCQSLQDTLAPAQNNICELTAKVDWLKSENGNLKDEVSLWKNRVNTLIEKDNQICPEDWKKIQDEHEALSKTLLAERENLRRITEEARKLKSDNTLLEKQIERLNNQILLLNESLKRKNSELSSSKVESEKINHELNEVKAKVTENNKEITNMNEKLSSNEAQLADIRLKEGQIRKIAKKYKLQYEELLKSMEDEKKKVEKLTAEAAISSETHMETSKEYEKKTQDYVEKINELNSQISKFTDENKRLQSEVDALKGTNQEIEEKAKNLLKQAKVKIVSLTEAKENLIRELNEAKAKVDAFEQSKDENDVRLQAIKSQYDGRVAKLDKEKQSMLQEKQAEIAQLNKQIEIVKTKMVQMQRKLTDGGTQSPKPSTSSNQGEKALTEPPPTANIKPMAGVASPRESNVRRTAGETPLASIRPMASAIRTAAVLPTSAQAASYSTMLHQAPHTTGSTSGDTTSSPSSSHNSTEYLPSSSSVGARSLPSHLRVVVLPSAESTQQDVESDNMTESDLSGGAAVPPSTSQSAALTQHTPQQGVALVMPRIDTTETQMSHTYQQQASSSSNSNSSSSTVTTSHSPNTKVEIQRAFKRPRITSAPPQQKTILKRFKTQTTESDADYQLPTSSQRDQEDDVNFSDLPDEENYTDDIDDNEMEEEKEQIPQLRMSEESSGPSNDQESSRSNEAELGCSEPQESQNVESDMGRSSSEPNVLPTLLSAPLQEQQIETISSGNGIPSDFLTIGANNAGAVTSNAVSGAYEDGDDSIVPSTPTLNVPTRNECFADAVRSPMTSRTVSGNEGRFTFSDGNAGGVMEDTLPDLAPQLTSHTDNITQAVSVADNIASIESSEAEVGDSSMVENIANIEATTSSQSSQVEEGREAEASTTARSSTPSRTHWEHRGHKSIRRGNSVHVHTPRPMDHQRPSPIVWNSDGNFRRGMFNQQRGMPRGGRHPLRRPPTFFKRFN